MHSRIKTIEVTKAYAKAFNAQNLAEIEAMLDGNETIFSRQGQATIVGARAILSRTSKMFRRLKKHGHELHMVNAIIDTDDSKARPCLMGILDGERFSIVVISVKPTGLIESIAILLTEAKVRSARPLEPLDCPEVEQTKAPPPPKVSAKDLMERKKGLRAKGKILKKRLEKEGPTPVLLEKIERYKKAKAKVKRLEEKLRVQA